MSTQPPTGPRTEVGQIATHAVDALKGNPSCLAAIMLAAVFAAITFWGVKSERELKSAETTLLLSRCFPAPMPGGPI